MTGAGGPQVCVATTPLSWDLKGTGVTGVHSGQGASSNLNSVDLIPWKNTDLGSRV